MDSLKLQQKGKYTKRKRINSECVKEKKKDFFVLIKAVVIQRKLKQEGNS